MKRQKSCGPRLGKLVHQLPGVVTFAYDLRFRRVIARWKGIIEEIHFGGLIMPLDIIENLNLEKPSFRPSKWPRKLKPAKNSKLPKWPENCFEPFGKGGWPLISTWINFVLTWSKQKFVSSTVAPKITIFGKGGLLAPESISISTMVIMSCQLLFIDFLASFFHFFGPPYQFLYTKNHLE
jgi:hypothetical protein